MKSLIKPIVAGLLAAALIGTVATSHAADKKLFAGKTDKADKKDAPKAKRDVLPFHGKVGAVDKTAHTITVGERTFAVTDATKITKDGEAATIDAAVVGEHVGGAYKKTDGKLEAVTLNFGNKPEKPEQPAKVEKPVKPAAPVPPLAPDNAAKAPTK